MKDNSTDDKLREATRLAFNKRGDQSAAAAHFNVSRQYVNQILNGDCKNEDMLLKLSEFIINRMDERKVVEGQKKTNTTRIMQALTL